MVVGRVLDLLESGAAVDAGAGVEIRFDRDELCRPLRIVVDVLHDDAAASQGQVEHVALFPGMLDAVEERMTVTLDDIDDLATLKLQLSGSAAGRKLLLKAKVGRERVVRYLGMHVPAHEALTIGFERSE